MPSAKLTARYLKLGQSDRPRFLAAVMSELTLCARGAYAPAGDGGDAVKLRSFNELQHRLAGHLWSLLACSPDRYPDDVLFTILLETADAGKCADDLGIAFDNAFERMTQPASPSGVGKPFTGVTPKSLEQRRRVSAG